MQKAEALRKQTEQNSVILRESDQALAGQKRSVRRAKDCLFFTRPFLSRANRQKNAASPVGTPKKAPAKRPRPDALKPMASEKNATEKPLVFQSKTGKTAAASVVAAAPAVAASKGELSPRKSPQRQKKKQATPKVEEAAPVALEQFLAELEALGSNSRADKVFVECLARFREMTEKEFGSRESREMQMLGEYLARLEAELKRVGQLPALSEPPAEEGELLPAEQARLEQLQQQWAGAEEVAQAYVESGIVMQQFSDQVQQLSNISEAIQARLEELAAAVMAESPAAAKKKGSKEGKRK